MKIRKLLLLLWLFLIFISQGYSQTSLKLQHHYFYYAETIAPRVTVSVWHKVSPKIYISAYFYVNPDWSQGLIGFDYSPNPNFMIGLKAGIQSKSNTRCDIDLLRVSPFIYFRIKKISFAAIYEYGGINDRSIALLDFNFKKSSAGLMFLKKSSFIAIGPRTDIKIPKIPLYIYVSALLTTDGKFASMSGLYVRLKSKNLPEIQPHNTN